jgi:flavorubredoxin
MGGNTRAAAKEVERGVGKVRGVRPVVKSAASAGTRDLVKADGYCIGTPDYFSYMAGMLKDFFDRVFYPSRGKTAGRPCGLFVSHGGGGLASRSLERIAKSFKLKRVGRTVLVKGRPGRAGRRALRALGSRVAREVLRR